MKKLSKRTNYGKGNIEAYNIYQCACFCGTICKLYEKLQNTPKMDVSQGWSIKMDMEA